MGFGRTAALRRRISQTEELTVLLRYIQTELQQRGTPLPDILQQAADRALSNPQMLADGAAQLRAGKTALAAISPHLSALDPETAQILRELCTTLGRYDSTTQSDACALAISRLVACQATLRLELAEKGRLYHTVPLALGLMAVMILF